MADLTIGTIVAISVAAGGVMQSAAPLYRALAGKRLASRKATLQGLAQRQDASEAAYQRLERENVRQAGELDDLYLEVGELRKELGLEQRAHDATKRALDRVTADCAACREVLAKVARRKDMEGMGDTERREEEP